MASFQPDKFLILVVDDLTTNLHLIGTLLDRVGYNITFATGGKQALERVQNNKPDLILLDLMMPDLNGLEVCEKLRNNLEYVDIPIIFLTASNSKNNLLQAFECGAVDYITKPFNTAELLARIRTHLELKHTRDELKKALEELEKLATTDSLTEILNRRYLLILGEQELKRAIRYNHPFSVLMIDIDHFKQINDTYGHAVGDEALKFMAKTTQMSLRQVDFFGRFGGEEFVAFLPETTTDEAIKVAERIRQTIVELSQKTSQKFASMTVSIGIASYMYKNDSLDGILMRADKALYQSKNQGRNQVVVYNQD